ncbi:hypothetical protein AQUSIP_15450 [Aquicella siphonis]|uniref:Uncharacterized protein n=2 Tax=Aquicella siphonis TaxID=254247 RepID=A0A5E4PGZ0_9COXI|nr:hypothetical protein AQUSIP_15450 [Aquicella siphonis]
MIILFAPVLLAGCKDKASYSYYMQHPAALKAAVTSCQSEYNKTADRAAECEIVLFAAENMISLINEQQENPEKFGQRILTAQMDYMVLKQRAAEADQSYQQLKNTHAPDARLRTAKDDLYKAKKACADKLEQIRILLAVVGMGSPD